MEFNVFLVVPHENNSFLNILSWNVNSVRTKLEQCNVYNYLANYDIISLNETKCLNLSVPGYVSYSSKCVKGAAALRGGTVVLVKNYLASQVYNYDNSMTDQVWFQIKCIPSVIFGFCYIPPSESTYFNHDLFAYFHEKMSDYKDFNEVLIIGDMNARLGYSVRNIPISSNNSVIKRCTYPVIPDEIQNSNTNGHLLSSICTDNDLVVLNNIKSSFCHFPSKKTFRRNGKWISELDTVVSSYKMLNKFDNFTVHQTDWLPSDHAPISIGIELPKVNLDILSFRAEYLGGHAALMGHARQDRMVSRPVRYDQIDVADFSNMIRDMPIPLNEFNDISQLAGDISNTLYNCAKSCLKRDQLQSGPPRLNSAPNIQGGSGTFTDYHSKWDQLLNDPDNSRVWKALDWKGEFIDNNSNVNSVSPSDSDFKNLYEVQFNQYFGANQGNNFEIDQQVNIPLLDDPIAPVEVSDQIGNMNPNKSCGPDGIPPGIFRLLTPEWIILLTTLFNLILANASYPLSWSKAKLFMLFKKGSRQDPNNYRGISVINSVAKIFDMVLCKRLELWFKPFREQAGAQKGRGCVEHIVTLRLLTDFAKKKRTKLFITFVDFSKAYDVVPRHMLFKVLQQIGCGAVMLATLIAMYSVTKSILGLAIITTLVGVRQGSPTSCLLFIIYVNDLIKLIKTTCQPDGFLSWLHLLMLMDDTVILATKKENMLQKVGLLKQFCNRYGMLINMSKTKFMVINGNAGDRRPLAVGDLVEHCEKYIYLGSPFTADGSLATVIKAHIQEKMCHFYKFIGFLNKNN